MIQHTQLGNTDIHVSKIGLGTVKFGRNQKIHYPESFSLPTDQQILALLDCARELGINLLDTAPAYGTSEERLGELLNGQRQQWILCTKVGEEFIQGDSVFDFSQTHIKNSIERSLTRLKTDYLDIVLVHSNGEDKEIIEQYAVFSTLADLKKSGQIRAFGMSTKTVEGGLLTVDHSDVVMVTYNPTHTHEQPVIAHAKQKNKGVLIKKALASGHLQKISNRLLSKPAAVSKVRGDTARRIGVYTQVHDDSSTASTKQFANAVGFGKKSNEDPVLASMQFIFQEPGISSIILGTLNQAHLNYNVQCAIKALQGL